MFKSLQVGSTGVKEVVVKRPDDHHKGPKEIARFPYGSPVPPGVIIGKGSIITIEMKS